MHIEIHLIVTHHKRKKRKKRGEKDEREGRWCERSREMPCHGGISLSYRQKKNKKNLDALESLSDGNFDTAAWHCFFFFQKIRRGFAIIRPPEKFERSPALESQSLQFIHTRSLGILVCNWMLYSHPVVPICPVDQRRKTLPKRLTRTVWSSTLELGSNLHSYSHNEQSKQVQMQHVVASLSHWEIERMQHERHCQRMTSQGESIEKEASNWAGKTAARYRIGLFEWEWECGWWAEQQDWRDTSRAM